MMGMASPAPAAWNVEVPFAVCATNGGPFDDASFIAGYQVGRVTNALAHGAELGADSMSFTVLRCLLAQIEVAGMQHGFPYTFAEPCADSSEWVHVVLSADDVNPFAENENEPDDPA